MNIHIYCAAHTFCKGDVAVNISGCEHMGIFMYLYIRNYISNAQILCPWFEMTRKAHRWNICIQWTLWCLIRTSKSHQWTGNLSLLIYPLKYNPATVFERIFKPTYRLIDFRKYIKVNDYVIYYERSLTRIVHTTRWHVGCTFYIVLCFAYMFTNKLELWSEHKSCQLSDLHICIGVIFI